MIKLIPIIFCVVFSLTCLAETNVLKPKSELLPEDLKKVDNASYPSINELVSGSNHAQSEQNNAVTQTGFPLEVETAKYKIKMRLIPAGTFIMGSPSSESNRNDDEVQHKVTISKPFYMGVYEVTQQQWKDVMGRDPSYFKNDEGNAPVEKVTWNDCQGFLNKLCDSLGVPHGTYRFPTEAEWEYACRAGTTSSYYGNDVDSIAWNGDNKGITTAWYGRYLGSTTNPVGTKKPNAFGLYDMSGNLWEWCSDWKGDYPSGSVIDPKGPDTGSHRVKRGGSWRYDASYCRSATRRSYSDNRKSGNIGLRVVRIQN